MKKLFKMLLATLFTVIMAISFASCTITGGLSLEKVGEKLKELGYEIELTVDEKDLKEIAEAENCGELLAVLTVFVSEESARYTAASIVWFKNNEDAELFVKQYQEFLDSLPEDYKAGEIPKIVSKDNFVVMGFSVAYEDVCKIMNV